MKVLLDECCPRQLRHALFEFDIETVEYAGFKGLKNGMMLAQAEERYSVLITADQNLRYPENLNGRRLAIIELPTNDWGVVKLLAPSITESPGHIVPGAYVRISNG
ncbi:MAG: hypothetical protein ACO1QB_06680 [Verrucomicrobiales bacterium]